MRDFASGRRSTWPTNNRGTAPINVGNVNQMARRSNRVSEMNDDQLLSAVARGDQRALPELFDRHSPWLAARLRRSLPADAVEDVLQETFIAV